MAILNSPFLTLLLISIAQVDHTEGFSSGAPSTACSTLLPDPGSHSSGPQPDITNPYVVDLTALDDGTGQGTYSYVPGQTYQSML